MGQPQSTHEIDPDHDEEFYLGIAEWATETLATGCVMTYDVQKIKGSYMTTTNPGKIISEGLAKVLPIETNEVFYNPVQVVNRDLSILMISNFAKRFRNSKITVLEGLAASGLRSIRYSKELRFGSFAITANDIEQTATERILKNIEYNRSLENSAPTSSISVSNADAVVHMVLHKNEYDVIDLDPYGSASPFLDSAVASVKPGGLLCITSTDGGVLCGNQPDMAFIRYGGFSLKKDYAHEMGIRVLLHAVAAAAGRYKRSIRVLAAFSIDFYFRIFIQVHESPNEALNNMTQSSVVQQCCRCEFHQCVAFGRFEERDSKKDGQPKNILRKPGRWPRNTSHCPECHSDLVVGGPIWTGATYDDEFLNECIEIVDSEVSLKETMTSTALPVFPGITSWTKLNGLFHGLKSELPDVPLFYSIPALVQSVKCSPPKLKVFQHFIESLGYRVGFSHRTPNAIKTDAPAVVVFDLLRLFVQKMETKPKNPLVPELLEKAVVTEFPQEISFDDEQLLKSIGKGKRTGNHSVPVYLPNPTPFWGPKQAAAMTHAAKRPKLDDQ